MGGLTRTIFGGGKSKNESGNKAYGTLLGLLTPGVERGNTAMSVLGSLLGIGGPGAGKEALSNFMDSTGYQFMLDSGSKAITGNAASRGLLNSGSTGQRLTRFGQELGQTKINEMMQNLTNLGQMGIQSAGVIGNAGQYSKGKSTNSNGIFNSLFPKGLSDRRVKNVVEEIGLSPDGIPVVIFEYRGYPGRRFIGVIAQDVQKIKPDALGPRKDGFLTVKYDDLEPIPTFPWGAIKEAA